MCILTYRIVHCLHVIHEDIRYPHRIQGYQKTQEEKKYIFIFASLYLKVSTSFYYECKQANKQNPVILAVPMTLSPIYLKIFFTFSTAWKLWLLSDPQLDHIINTCKCTVRSTYMAHSKFFNILINVFNITGFPCILCILLYACKSSF